MKVNTITIPSIFESSYGNAENMASGLLTGMRIKQEDKWYMVGELAKRNGINPHRIINAAPSEEDYEILFKAALLSVHQQVESPLTVTLGLPFSTFNAYQREVERFLDKKFFTIEYDSSTYANKGGVQKVNVEIAKFDIIPELVGNIVGLKKILQNNHPENFIMISLGYGTAEGGMVTPEGLLQRSSFSTHGLRYVITNAHKELSKRHYLELKNEFQINDALNKGYMFVNRKNIDLKGIREEIITQYYKEVISPLIRSNFSDRDFESAEKIYITGGGVYFEDLVDCFNNEFRDVLKVELAPFPEKLASIGYLHHAMRMSDGNNAHCVGIDLGNSSTVVSVPKAD